MNHVHLHRLDRFQSLPLLQVWTRAARAPIASTVSRASSLSGTPQRSGKAGTDNIASASIGVCGQCPKTVDHAGERNQAASQRSLHTSFIHFPDIKFSFAGSWRPKRHGLDRGRRYLHTWPGSPGALLLVPLVSFAFPSSFDHFFHLHLVQNTKQSFDNWPSDPTASQRACHSFNPTFKSFFLSSSHHKSILIIRGPLIALGSPC
ncbi:hypothetical protein GGR57DRAFT_356134 [Xylariaceae sp. FL1272]|nr:hypothetical protein GGR57DRAFT_356134 [Xylariaceae sp. FL1272]